ncbi:MAG: hypothetical protein KDA61_16160 [Planctomycetales bacterium]|nr:hypothetical protein [Planctomycetales bacterium]
MRSLTISRMSWWLALASFPPALLGLVRYLHGVELNVPEWFVPMLVYVLCPGVVAMLGVFLWASPALASELEGRSWVYLAVRPQGGPAVVLGKYLVAVAWSAPAAVLSSAASLAIFNVNEFATYPRDLWLEARLSVLSCVCYGAIFTLIGVVLPKRSMVIGIVYVAIFEVVLSTVPAAVNLATIQFRLRVLALQWIEPAAADWNRIVREVPILSMYDSPHSPAWHVGALLAMTAGVLALAVALLRVKEFTAESESDV